MTDTVKALKSEVKIGTVMHRITGLGYLGGPYLSDAYLVGEVQAHLRTQADLLGSYRLLSQVRLNLYNLENARVLCEFPSRGIDGLSWTVVSGGQAPGHFNVNNLNTDIVEEPYRSTSKIIKLQNDCQIPQGCFLDTMGILEHNLTTSATIVMLESNDPGFGTIGNSFSVTSRRNNIYYVAPNPPTVSFKYRRLQIADPTNTNPYLQIGAVVFGPATIMESECFVDHVGFKRRHFSDKVRTEGFTNVSSDRALKRAFTLEFRNLKLTGGNYRQFAEMFEHDRTNLKCLWIPTPRYPERYGLFGKLVDLPPEDHNDLGEDSDWVGFTVEVDESL